MSPIVVYSNLGLTLGFPPWFLGSRALSPPVQSELVPCMDAVNQNYMNTISLVKRYRPPNVNRSHSHIAVTHDVNISAWRESAAVQIQALVRMHQAYTK